MIIKKLIIATCALIAFNGTMFGAEKLGCWDGFKKMLECGICTSPVAPVNSPVLTAPAAPVLITLGAHYREGGFRVPARLSLDIGLPGQPDKPELMLSSPKLSRDKSSSKTIVYRMRPDGHMDPEIMSREQWNKYKETMPPRLEDISISKQYHASFFRGASYRTDKIYSESDSESETKDSKEKLDYKEERDGKEERKESKSDLAG